MWTNIPSELSEIASGVENAYKILYRSKIISQFLVVVHPLISKNADFSYISFQFDYDGAYIDWPYSKDGSTSMLVDNKIIDRNEATIFEELGILIHEGSEELKLTRIPKLYQEFFKGKDPFEVIFTLPCIQ